MAIEHRYDKPDFAIPTVKLPMQGAGFDNAFTRLIRRAEDRGYDRVWNVETNDREIFAQSALMALSSSRVVIGTDIVSFFSRTPTVLAMGAMGLHEMSNGRFILGVGPGGTQIISDGHGISFQRPLRRARESLQIIRGLLTQERFNFQGNEFNITRDFRLRLRPSAPSVPIYTSAINPKMLELAGELADGVILSHLPLEAVADVKERVAAGAARAGRAITDVHVLANLPIGIEDDEAIFAMRRSISLYLASETFDWLVGHTEWVALQERIKELWWSGRRDEAAMLAPDEFVETFGVGFRPNVIEERVHQYLEAGVVPILYPYGIRKGREEADMAELLDLGIKGIL